MERRVFLRWCGSGVVFGVIGCVPSAPSRKMSPASEPETPPNAPPMNRMEDAAALPDANEDVDGGLSFDSGGSRDTGSAPDAAEIVNIDSGACDRFVEMHDTYAQALYFDGTLGPLTGTITVDQMTASVAVDMEFWHGHDGVQHHFVVTAAHFAALKRGERALLETTEVDSHAHQLFIDPVDENYRVPGAPDVRVPLC